jgi:hypothetical protein
VFIHAIPPVTLYVSEKEKAGRPADRDGIFARFQTKTQNFREKA